MALITMSKKELGRLEALVDLDGGRITAARAAGLVGVGERQVFRLLKAYRASGAEGLVDRPLRSGGFAKEPEHLRRVGWRRGKSGGGSPPSSRPRRSGACWTAARGWARSRRSSASAPGS